MKANSKAKRADCEKAAVHYCRENHKCVYTRRAIRTQFQSVDFFAADVVGKRKDGSHVYVQATAGQASAVSARRKKLEAIPWHYSDTVELVQLVQTENPANARQTLWFFRVHEYSKQEIVIEGKAASFSCGRIWKVKEEAVSIPKEWFKAYKEQEE
jgi:hypothetical protein